VTLYLSLKDFISKVDLKLLRGYYFQCHMEHGGNPTFTAANPVRVKLLPSVVLRLRSSVTLEILSNLEIIIRQEY